LASLALAKRAGGVQVQFRNGPTDSPVTIWAVPNRGMSVLQLRDTAPTDNEDMEFTIPRQTGFPPTSFSPGAVIIYESAEYEIDSVTPSRGHASLSGTFDVSCGRYRSISGV
jgi:hypothetical protein